MGGSWSQPPKDVVLTPAQFHRLKTEDDYSLRESDIGKVTEALDTLLHAGFTQGLHVDVATSPELGNLLGISLRAEPHKGEKKKKSEGFFHKLSLGDISLRVVQSDFLELPDSLPVSVQARAGFSQQGFDALLSADYLYKHSVRRVIPSPNKDAPPKVRIDEYVDAVTSVYAGGASTFRNSFDVQAGLRHTNARQSGGVHLSHAQASQGARAEDTVTAWALQQVGRHGILGGEVVYNSHKSTAENARASKVLFAAGRVTVPDSALAQPITKQGRARKPCPVNPVVPEYQFRVESSLDASLLKASYFRRFVFRRPVYNPTEASNVMGIENPVDVGCEYVLDKNAQSSNMSLAGAWQPNKSILIKGKASREHVHVATAFKLWSYPSISFGLSSEHTFGEPTSNVGFFLKVEDYGGVLYQRPSKRYDTELQSTGDTLRTEVPRAQQRA